MNRNFLYLLFLICGANSHAKYTGNAPEKTIEALKKTEDTLRELIKNIENVRKNLGDLSKVITANSHESKETLHDQKSQVSSFDVFSKKGVSNSPSETSDVSSSSDFEPEKSNESSVNTREFSGAKTAKNGTRSLSVPKQSSEVRQTQSPKMLEPNKTPPTQKAWDPTASYRTIYAD